MFTRQLLHRCYDFSVHILFNAPCLFLKNGVVLDEMATCFNSIAVALTCTWKTCQTCAQVDCMPLQLWVFQAAGSL